MNTLTGHLPEQSRSAVRFVIVGTVGTGVQYLLYALFLHILEIAGILTDDASDNKYVSFAFTAAFLIEMCLNYLLTCYYTFSRKPTLKNAGGFFSSRVANFFIQIGLLHLLLYLSVDENLSGIVAILVAGVVNYFLLRIFYKKSHKNNQSPASESQL